MSIAWRVSLSHTLYWLMVAFHRNQVGTSTRHRKVICSLALLHVTRAAKDRQCEEDHSLMQDKHFFCSAAAMIITAAWVCLKMECFIK